MAGLIKKQILKHLSKFAKNLSADKINLSTLRGEGELSNLELDCVALQNVMNLPTWLQINRANCNRVHVKIPWTKLKTTPICIYLDAVDVEMITCEKPREPNGPSPIQASASGGDTSYGFTVKVLEGMTVNINSISVNFTSAAFTANFQLSQLSVVSTNPKWENTDLRTSRIQDKTLGQVLTFKKISWQTMRIVANAVISGDKNTITPLRLITNQSEIKMTFRRKVSDCSVLASRLHVHFDDLLWVLTDSQVQSALLCAKSLRDTIERSSQQMRELGLDKSHETHQPTKPSSTAKDETDDQFSSKYFYQYAVIESAVHLDFDRVDLHICEESSPLHKVSSKAGLQGGAIQISLHNVKVDHYPYHKPASDRQHFRDYGETMIERDSWAESVIKQFRRDFAVLKRAAESAGNLTPANTNRKPARLVENCLVIRLSDIDIHQVTTSNSKKQSGGRLINSTRKELHLPDEMPLFHFIRTEYYYPDRRDFPAPHDNIFMQINAPQFHAHWDSLIWLNRLSSVTVQAVQKMLEDLGIISESDEDDPPSDISPLSNKEEEHTDIRIQVLMPKVFIPGPTSTHLKQPHGLEIQVSKAIITNCRQGIECTRIHLKNILHELDKQHLTKNPSSFPSEDEIDMAPSQGLLKSHASGKDSPLAVILATGNPTLTRAALISHAKNDVWSVDLENIWIDFVMPSNEKPNERQDQPSGGFLGLSKSNDPVTSGTRFPFIDSFPAQLWIGKSMIVSDGMPKLATPVLVPDKWPILSPSSSVSDVCSPVQADIANINSHSSSMDHCNLNTNRSFSSHDPLTASSSASSVESGEHGMSSPRTARNKRLLEYYRSTDPALNEPKGPDTTSHDDGLSIASTSSTTNKVMSTYILLYTDKSLRLQLDHYQYLYLLHLIDTIEDVGKQLEASSKEALSSTQSSASSTPSHSAKMQSTSRNRLKKFLETTSIRIGAPFADLFLILRPPPSNVSKEDLDGNSICESITSSNKSPGSNSLAKDCSSSESVKSESIPEENSKLNVERPAPKLPFSVQDTPPLSECGSDTLSIQGSDNLSIFGDSFTSQGGMYPHNEIGFLPSIPKMGGGPSTYPHEASDNEDIPLLPGDQNFSRKTLSDRSASPAEIPPMKDGKVTLSKQKSGSFSVLSSAGAAVTSNLTSRLIQRNHSSENLRVSMSTSDQRLIITNVTTSKNGSSGYESGSRDSLPIPPVLDNVKRSKPTHSHSSSDASDQFVVIQVDDKGKGNDEFASVKLSKRETTSVSSRHASETSSLSSQSLLLTELSKSELMEESTSTCEMVDSQITVTNIETESLSSSTTNEKESESKSDEVEKKAHEMSSLVLLHVSDGIEVGIDSNDIGDSIVKIVAHNALVKELGTRKSEKNDSIFVEYSPKKCISLFKKEHVSMPSAFPNVCLRVDSGPLASRLTPVAVEDGHIHLSADRVSLALRSSTLANLGAFVEDDVPPKIVPMKIEASDVKLTIKDDMPPVYEATPPADPITLHVHSATVKRTDDGTFHVSTSTSGGKSFRFPTSQNKPSESQHFVKSKDTSASPSTPTPVRREPTPNDNAAEVLEQDTVVDAGKTQISNGCSSVPETTSGDCGNSPTKGEADNENLRLLNEISDLRKKLVEVEAHRDTLTEVLERTQEDLISSERERSNLRAQFTP